MMDFKSAFEYLKSFVSYEDLSKINYDEQDFNLRKLVVFLEKYGVNFGDLKFIHIAGSKGKGSLANLYHDYLKNIGLKVGLFTSPFIVDATEMMKVNGISMEKDDFVRRVEDLKRFIDLAVAPEITYFELITVLALKYFVDLRVDYVVLEVGLGGRLDSTNIVSPVQTNLTFMEMEHADVLGDTLQKILREKMGILKPGVPMIVGRQTEVVNKMIVDEYKPMHSAIVFVENNCDAMFVGYRDGMMIFDFLLNGVEYRGVEVAGGSLVNGQNLAHLLVGVQNLLGAVDEAAFRLTARSFFIPGRFDLRIWDGQKVLFDMAHTKYSVANLTKSLMNLYPGEKFVFLFAVLKGKDLEGMLSAILPLAKSIVFTFVHEERGVEPEELAKAAMSLGFDDVYLEKDPLAAWDLAKKNTDSSMLVATGSHFLVSRIWELNASG